MIDAETKGIRLIPVEPKYPLGKTYIIGDHQSWGNKIGVSIEHLTAWGCVPNRPVNGDIIHVSLKDGMVLGFQFVNMQHKTNPKDLFFSDLICLGEWVDD